ncbi:acyl-CoA dehydrogenase family protein [Dietzia kunjamensis]|uniref:acyl-CoA dehydrogenase family protein n=1 Tax=Dietzia kunjamensis TaxID=322509 RepID=UPI0033694431
MGAEDITIAGSAWKTPERRALREVVRSFAEKEIVPNLDQWERDGKLPRELHEKAGELGLLAAGYPEELGGTGDLIDQMIVCEEMVRAGASTGVLASLFSHTIAIPSIIRSGNQDLIEKFAIPALEGKVICSLGITEPGTGSDVAGVTTKAVRDGDHFIVNGAKLYITSGVRADFVTLAVRTGGPGHGGVSLLVIEKGSPGFEVSRSLEKMGWWCSDTAELSFVDARVPVANLVGPENEGFLQIVKQFQSERLMLAVESYATAQRCLELTLQWVRDRHSFGAPLSNHQVVRHKLAEMARQTDVAKEYTRRVVERYVAGEDVSMEVSMAKNTAVQAGEFVAHQAVQLFGGMGYMRESEVERHYRDIRIMGIGGGTVEIMNEVIAKKLGLTPKRM